MKAKTRSFRYPVIVATRMSEDQAKKFDKYLGKVNLKKSEFFRNKIDEVINPKSKAQ